MTLHVVAVHRLLVHHPLPRTIHLRPVNLSPQGPQCRLPSLMTPPWLPRYLWPPLLPLPDDLLVVPTGLPGTLIMICDVCLFLHLHFCVPRFAFWPTLTLAFLVFGVTSVTSVGLFSLLNSLHQFDRWCRVWFLIFSLRHQRICVSTLCQRLGGEMEDIGLSLTLQTVDIVISS